MTRIRDLIVVGGGFFGVAMAAYAQRRGRDVILVDDARAGGASRAASGYYSPRWYKDRSTALRAAETAQALGLDLHLTRASVIDLAQPEAQRGPKPFPELYVFDRAQYLRPVAGVYTGERADYEAGQLLLWEGSGFAIRLETDEVVAAKAIYLAAGIWTDELLHDWGMEPVGVSALGGSAALFAEELPSGAFEHPLWLRTGPYSHVALRSWGGMAIRVCATQERTADRTVEARMKMLAVARASVPGLGRDPAWEYGMRPMLDGGPQLVERADGLVLVGTGGGRIGAIAAFDVAERAYRRFEEVAWKS